MAYWKCPAGDFTAMDEREKREHLKEMARDRKHRDTMIKKARQKGADIVEDLKDKAEDLLDKFS